MNNDPRFKYVNELHDLKVGQVRNSGLAKYTIIAIEQSGFVLCRVHRQTKRIWCDLISSWREVIQ